MWSTVDLTPIATPQARTRRLGMKTIGHHASMITMHEVFDQEIVLDRSLHHKLFTAIEYNFLARANEKARR
jgi:hypothetical protein